MRLLFVTDAWFPQVNGVVTTMSKVVELLRAKGHAVKVVEPNMFRSVPMPTYPEIRLSVDVWRVGKIINEFNPDRIHVVTEGSLGLAAISYLRAHGYNYTSAFHTKFPEYVNARLPMLPVAWGYKYMHAFHAKSKRVLVPSNSAKRDLTAKGVNNVVCWSRGVDTKTFKPLSTTEQNPLAEFKSPIYLYVGRVAKEKNIQAFLDVDIAGKKVVVGDGPLRQSLEKKYPQVLFAGYKSGRDLGRYFAAADVFVFPSLTDTYGVVMLEAMACGTPVAAYEVTGPVDVVENGVTGFLDSDLKRAIINCKNIKRQACRDYAKQHSWKKAAQILLENMVDKGDSRLEFAKGLLSF